MAKREFSAFISAVKELLGPEQAPDFGSGLARRVGINHDRSFAEDVD